MQINEQSLPLAMTRIYSHQILSLVCLFFLAGCSRTPTVIKFNEHATSFEIPANWRLVKQADEDFGPYGVIQKVGDNAPAPTIMVYVGEKLFTEAKARQTPPGVFAILQAATIASPEEELDSAEYQINFSESPDPEEVKHFLANVTLLGSSLQSFFVTPLSKDNPKGLSLMVAAVAPAAEIQSLKPLCNRIVDQMIHAKP